jgi:hypothetical protein
MTENSVAISISINGAKREIIFERKLELEELERSIGMVLQKIGCCLFQVGIEELD